MPGPAPPHPPPRGCGGYPSLRCGNRRLGNLCFFISIRQVHEGLSAVKTCHGLSSWGVKLEMYIFPFELHPGSCRSNNVKPPVLQRQGFNVTTWRGVRHARQCFGAGGGRGRSRSNRSWRRSALTRGGRHVRQCFCAGERRLGWQRCDQVSWQS